MEWWRERERERESESERERERERERASKVDDRNSRRGAQARRPRTGQESALYYQTKICTGMASVNVNLTLKDYPGRSSSIQS
jgi:hypothetical protein